MECAKCKARVDPGPATSPSFGRASLEVLKDWRFWVFAVVVSLVAGVTKGVLHLHTAGFAGGAGALIGLSLFFRSRTVRRCPSCGAVFQSAPWLGRGKAG